jgi:hypothetical protein
MRIIFKILAAPFVLVLTVAWALLVFLFCWAEMILNFVSGLAMLVALILFVTGQTTGGVVYTVIAFLVSPVGLPAIASWLIDLLDSLNDALKCFIAT